MKTYHTQITLHIEIKAHNKAIAAMHLATAKAGLAKSLRRSVSVAPISFAVSQLSPSKQGVEE